MSLVFVKCIMAAFIQTSLLLSQKVPQSGRCTNRDATSTMTESKHRLDPQNAHDLANALAGLLDGTYVNSNQASKATGVRVQTIYDRLN